MQACKIACHSSGCFGAKETAVLTISCDLMQALELQFFMAGRRVGHALSRVPLQPASKRPLDESSLRDALGQLGDNTLCLGALDTSTLDLDAGAVPWQAMLRCVPASKENILIT